MLFVEHKRRLAKSRGAWEFRILDDDSGGGMEFAGMTIHSIHQSADEISPLRPRQRRISSREGNAGRMSDDEAFSIVTYEGEKILLLLLAHRSIAAGQKKNGII